MLEIINKYSKWHEFLVHHRNPTAHRIPPYVIPYTVPNKLEKNERIDYTPKYIHSFKSKYGIIPLHAQSLADACTVASLLDLLLKNVEALINE